MLLFNSVTRFDETYATASATENSHLLQHYPRTGNLSIWLQTGAIECNLLSFAPD
jgi:hypothetical protein